MLRPEVVESVISRVNHLMVRPQLYDYESTRHRSIFDALTQGVQYVYNTAVEGDIFDFGTAFGFSCLTMARAMGCYRQMYSGYTKAHGTPQKNLYLLDSFQGLPEPDHPVDVASPNVSSGRWQKGTFTSLSKEELFAVCSTAYDADKIKIVEGWFSESLKTLPSETKIAMAHIDCDIYSSSIEVLDYIFGHNHVSDGCCIFFDDWNCNRASPKFGQRRAWQEVVDKYNIRFSDSGEYGVLCRKFIVHMD
jgi:O-methyltransferase